MSYTVQEITDLREKRMSLAQEAQKVLDTAKSEKREMTDEERGKFDAIHDDIDRFGKDVERMERQRDTQKELEQSRGRIVTPESQSGDSRDGGQPDQMDEFRKWALNEDGSQGKKFSFANPYMPQSRLQSCMAEYRNARNFTEARSAFEARALATSPASAGGSTIAEDFHNVLEVALLQFGGMRQVRSSVLRTATGAAMPMPTANDTGNKGRIVGEGVSVNKVDPTFDRVILDAYKYTSEAVLISYELLQDSAFNMANFLGTALGERIGRITNEHFTVGTGTNQPNGVITAAPVGAAAGEVNEFVYQDWVELIHSVDPAYRGNAEFMFHDKILRDLKKLEDGDERPLWLPGIAMREPDTINGYRYVINQDMEDTLAASNVIAAFGDFSKYYIRDVMDLMLIRLDEVYAEDGQVAFLAFSRHDGDLLDAGTGPIKTLRMAAS